MQGNGVEILKAQSGGYKNGACKQLKRSQKFTIDTKCRKDQGKLAEVTIR